MKRAPFLAFKGGLDGSLTTKKAGTRAYTGSYYRCNMIVMTLTRRQSQHSRQPHLCKASVCDNEHGHWPILNQLRSKFSLVALAKRWVHPAEFLHQCINSTRGTNLHAVCCCIVKGHKPQRATTNCFFLIKGYIGTIGTIIVYAFGFLSNY